MSTKYRALFSTAPKAPELYVDTTEAGVVVIELRGWGEDAPSMHRALDVDEVERLHQALGQHLIELQMDAL